MASVVKRAKRLRQDQTDAERKLWFRLRDRRLEGLKFRRQMPLGQFIADFCCEEAHLIIEVDGGQHNENDRDVARTKLLEAMGYLVLRFWNNDVLSNIDGVLETIVSTAKQQSAEPPHPDPLPTGEREKKAAASARISLSHGERVASEASRVRGYRE
jgi:very-short-patch-repair endonuclease